MKKSLLTFPYEAPAVVIKTITPPKVLCMSGERYNAKAGSFDDDSD